MKSDQFVVWIYVERMLGQRSRVYCQFSLIYPALLSSEWDHAVEPQTQPNYLHLLGQQYWMQHLRIKTNNHDEHMYAEPLKRRHDWTFEALSFCNGETLPADTVSGK